MEQKPRLELTRERARVIRDGATHDLGRPASIVLRLLTWEPDPLEQAKVVAGLLELRKTEESPRPLKDLGPLLTPIRKAVGDALVKVEGPPSGGAKFDTVRYRGNFDGFSLDTTDFALLVNELQPRLEQGGDERWLAPERLDADFGSRDAYLLDGGRVEEVDMWREAVKTYQVNPGVQLTTFPSAKRVFDEFADHRWTIIWAAALGYACRYLRDGQDTWLARAVTHLSGLDSDGDMNEDLWQLRLRLVGSREDWRSAVPDMCRSYLKANNPAKSDEEIEDLELPEELAQLAARIKDRDPDVLLRPRVRVERRWGTVVDVAVLAPTDEGEAGTAQVHHDGTVDRTPRVAAAAVQKRADFAAGDPTLLEVVTKLGITPASAVALRSSHVTPVECCDQVDRRLWFSGIMANKWVLEEDAYRAFDALLYELDTYEETDPLCRLMVVNPESRAGAKLKKRGLLTDRELKSIPVLQDLILRHPSFEVRMYETLPTFRLIIVDQVFVTVAPYLNVLPDLVPDRGWGVPHLVLKPSAEYPLAHSFIALFEQAWDACRKNPLPMS